MANPITCHDLVAYRLGQEPDALGKQELEAWFRDPAWEAADRRVRELLEFHGKANDRVLALEVSTSRALYRAELRGDDPKVMMRLGCYPSGRRPGLACVIDDCRGSTPMLGLEDYDW